MLPSKCFARE